jgi:hypothetical protein
MNSGQTLEHYEIIRSLVKGGMGKVYLVDDIQLGPAYGYQSSA